MSLCSYFATFFVYSIQEEQWHEANFFPSISPNKDDVTLFLGKRLPPHPQPFTPAGTPSHLSASAAAAAADSTTTGGSALRTGPTAEGHLSDESCTTVTGVSCGGLPAAETNTAEGDPENHRGVGTGTGSAAGRQTDATSGEEWDGDMIDEQVEEESEVDDEMDGSGEGAPCCSSEREISAGGESREGGADPARPRGVGMRKRLSSRLANWPPFRKPKVRVGVCR